MIRKKINWILAFSVGIILFSCGGGGSSEPQEVKNLETSDDLLSILDEINGSLATYFICQDSSLNPCGYAKLIQSPIPECMNPDSCIELQRLYVDSDYRGRGIGKLLESHAESNSRNRDIRKIWLRVWEGNTVAQEIYKKWGFTIIGEEQYQVGEDQRTVLLMGKPLSSEQ